MSVIYKKKRLSLILIGLVLLYIIGRCFIASWFTLMFYYLIVIPPIWHVIIHLRYLKKLIQCNQSDIEFIYLSHVVFLVLTLFQFDFGDGPYFVFLFEIIEMFESGFRDNINAIFESQIWSTLQWILLTVFFITESLLTIRLIISPHLRIKK